MAHEIPLPSGHVALVDDDDFSSVSGTPWHVHKGPGGLFYAVWQPYLGGGRKGARRGRVFLHHMIVGMPPDGMVIDHRNGNGLDNRRGNLRVCSHSRNGQNQKPRAGRLKGVSVAGRGFQVRIAGKYLGCYRTEIEAALAYDHAAKQTFGEFARLNFPDVFPVGLHAPEHSDETDPWRHKRIASLGPSP